MDQGYSLAINKCSANGTRIAAMATGLTETRSQFATVIKAVGNGSDPVILPRQGQYNPERGGNSGAESVQLVSAYYLLTADKPTRMFASYNSPPTPFRDKRAEVDPKDFMFDGLDTTTAIKNPGSVNGQQFIIQNCKFRTRDCRNIRFLLHCATQPIIEASMEMKFACLQLSYPQLIDQINLAGLSVFNNLWGKIHDFTPVTGEPNFSLMGEEINLEEYLPKELIDNFSVSAVPSVIPRTLGPRRKPSKEISFVMIFLTQDSVEDTKARCLALALALTQEQLWLVQSKEIKMQPSDVERILGSKKYSEAVDKGPVVSLEFCGSDVHRRLKEGLETQKLSGIAYLAEPEIAASQSHSFYNYYDMQMGI